MTANRRKLSDADESCGSRNKHQPSLDPWPLTPSDLKNVSASVSILRNKRVSPDVDHRVRQMFPARDRSFSFQSRWLPLKFIYTRQQTVGRHLLESSLRAPMSSLKLPFVPIPQTLIEFFVTARGKLPREDGRWMVDGWMLEPKSDL